MYIYVRDFGQHSMEFLDVLDDDMSRRFVVRPFDWGYISSHVAGGGKIFCLGKHRFDQKQKSYSTQLVVLDDVTGAQILATSLPFPASNIAHLPKNNLLCTQGLDRSLVFLDASTLDVVWTIAPLFAPELKRKGVFGSRVVAEKFRDVSEEGILGLPGSVYAGAVPFEDKAGKIWSVALSENGDGKDHKITGASHGLFLFDPVQKTSTFHLVEFSPWGTERLMTPSPDGAMVVRRSPQWRLGPAFETVADRNGFAWIIEHQDLDIWSVSDQTPINRVHVGDMPARHYIGSPHSIPRDRLNRLAAWTQSGKDKFRRPHSPPPGKPKLNSDLDATRDLLSLRDNQRLFVHWEDDSRAFWVATRSSLRRVKPDGTKGPLLIFDRFLNDAHRDLLHKRPPGTDFGVGETFPALNFPYVRSVDADDSHVRIGLFDCVIRIPKRLAMSDQPMVLVTDDMIEVKKIPALRAADIADKIPGLVRIKSWAQKDVVAGLQGLADALEKDFLTQNTHGVSLVFQVRSSFLPEKKFFAKLADKDIDVTDSVKAVINAWCAGLRKYARAYGGDQDGAGPLSYALQYLAQRDEGCAAQLGEYCLLRDGEHESFSRDTVLKGFLDKMGLTTPELWRLGILYALLFGRDGRMVMQDGKSVSDWVHTGVLPAAQQTLSPKDFVALFHQTTADFASQPDNFAAFGTHAEAVTNATKDLVAQLTDSPWDQAVKTALLGPWGAPRL